MGKHMRKFWGLLFLILVNLVGCQLNTSDKSLCTITFDDFDSKMKQKESFVLIIGRDDCPDCIALKEMLEEKNIDMEQLVYLRYSLENQDVFLYQIEEYFKDIKMIPYYAIIEEGIIVNTGQGYTNEEDFIDFISQENV